MSKLLMNILKGKLTYLVAGSAIAWGVFGFLGGHIDGDAAGQLILFGLGAFGIRRAM